MGAREFTQILDKMQKIHDLKGHDYAQEGNPYSNFERAAEIVSWFKDPVDQVFATLIGVKLARLAELHGGKEAKNEPMDDSHLDLNNYSVLWHGYTRKRYQP